MTDLVLSRRRFAQGLGIVVATFAWTARSSIGQAPSNLPFSLRNNRKLEGWIRLEPDNSVVIFTGKAELGQGILTALAQIAAEELDVEFDKIQLVSADTTRGPTSNTLLAVSRSSKAVPPFALLAPKPGQFFSLRRRAASVFRRRN